MSSPFAARIAVVAATIVAAAAIAALPSSAQTDPIVSVDAVIDDDGDTSPDNGSTSVGPLDSCTSMSTGASLQVDVVIQDVTDLAGFQNNLLYNPAVLKVTAVDYNFILSSTGSSVLDFGEDITSDGDTDGDFFMSAAMFNLLAITGASGDGVLGRVTLEAVGAGTSPLDLTEVKLSDSNGDPIPPVDASNFYAGPVNSGTVVVDGSCADADSDGDGYTDANEGIIGTDPNDSCSDTAIENDERGSAFGEPEPAWPPDFDDNQVINITDVGKLLPPTFGSAVPPASPRLDIEPSGTINISDVGKLLPPTFGTSCTQ